MPRLNHDVKYNVTVKGENGDAKEGILKYDATAQGFKLKTKGGKEMVNGTFQSIAEIKELTGYRVKTTGVAA